MEDGIGGRRHRGARLQLLLDDVCQREEVRLVQLELRRPDLALERRRVGGLCQIGVSMTPGSTTATRRPHGMSSLRSDIPTASMAYFDAASPRVRRGDPAAERRDEHDAAVVAPQQRERGLGDGDLPDDVDLELLAPVVEGHDLDGSGERHPGVVDEGVEAVVAELLGDGGQRGAVPVPRR